MFYPGIFDTCPMEGLTIEQILTLECTTIMSLIGGDRKLLRQTNPSDLVRMLAFGAVQDGHLPDATFESVLDYLDWHDHNLHKFVTALDPNWQKGMAMRDEEANLLHPDYEQIARLLDTEVMRRWSSMINDWRDKLGK